MLVVIEDTVRLVIVGGAAETVNANPALQSLARVDGPTLVSPKLATDLTYAYQVNPVGPGPVLSVIGLEELDASKDTGSVVSGSPVVQ